MKQHRTNVLGIMDILQTKALIYIQDIQINCSIQEEAIILNIHEKKALI